MEGLAQNVLKLYMDYDMQQFDKCSSEYLLKMEAQQKEEEEAKQQWQEIEKLGA